MRGPSWGKPYRREARGPDLRWAGTTTDVAQHSGGLPSSRPIVSSSAECPEQGARHSENSDPAEPNKQEPHHQKHSTHYRQNLQRFHHSPPVGPHSFPGVQVPLSPVTSSSITSMTDNTGPARRCPTRDRHALRPASYSIALKQTVEHAAGHAEA